MALQYITLDARCNPRFCDDVYLCLQTFWENQTVSGIAIVKGSVVSVLGQVFLQQPPVCPPPNPCNPCAPVPYCPPRCPPTDPCQELCRYQIAVDDTLFLIDPGTNLPYVLVANDVLEISQTTCLIDRIIGELCDCSAINPPARLGACTLAYYTGV